MLASESTLSVRQEAWPALPLAEWQETYATLHMWTQIVGKARLALSPHLNHWWEVPFYVTARGLTTSPIPYRGEIIEVQFDFIDHRLHIDTSWGERRALGLMPKSVADFYGEFLETLRELGIQVKIWPMPVEVPNPIRFDEDEVHAAYDTEQAHRFFLILRSADTVLKEFRSRFIGKDSPVHFFWGSFDLCVTRFSGRRAPERPEADRVTREAYSHEVSSAGFWPGGSWPGGAKLNGAAFYSYAVPEPPGFRDAPVRPEKAFYHAQFREFFLMYDDLRASENPREDLLEFLQSTYEVAADLGNWDRAALERAG
jgi:hypothetical protein